VNSRIRVPLASILDQHWFQCLSGIDILTQCGFLSRLSCHNVHISYCSSKVLVLKSLNFEIIAYPDLKNFRPRKQKFLF
jgi:hypothetical protein